MVATMVKDALQLSVNENFVAQRKGVLNPQTLSKEERVALIKKIQHTETLSADVKR